MSGIVEFVSYSGKYPCLCVGELKLKINGKIFSFLNSGGKGYFKSFWSSGGECYFTNGYSEEVVTKSNWIIDKDDLPEELVKYADEIEKAFNDNVPHGCCGGCL